ncbi:hypothetical protein PG989_004384 [Apiospora arundinis]
MIFGGYLKGLLKTMLYTLDSGMCVCSQGDNSNNGLANGMYDSNLKGKANVKKRRYRLFESGDEDI